MDWIIEMTNVDGPYRNTNNCDYLDWMRNKEKTMLQAVIIAVLNGQRGSISHGSA